MNAQACSLIRLGTIRVRLIQLAGRLQCADTMPLAIRTLESRLEGIPGVEVRSTILEDQGESSIDNSGLNELFTDVDIVGISIPQGTSALALNLLDRSPKGPHRPLIVLGHSLPTNDPDWFLDRFPDVIVVRGWGEDTFASIVNIRLKNSLLPNSLDCIPNLAFRKEGATVLTPPEWPHEFTTVSPRHLDGRTFRVEASRGCHHNVCTFCTRNPGNVKWAPYPVQDVVRYILYLKSSGVRRFAFTDEDFVGSDVDRALQLSEKIAEIGGLSFNLSLRADNIFNPNDDEAKNQKRLAILKNLKSAGLVYAMFGAESLSVSQLKRYGKGIDPSVNIAAARRLAELDIPFEMGFILFDPFVTWDELSENAHRLDQTGLWRRVGHLFTQLHAQRNSPFVALIQREGLITTYKPDTLEYLYQYRNESVGTFAGLCTRAMGESDPIYRISKAIDRSTFPAKDVDEFFQDWKRADFNLLMRYLREVRGEAPSESAADGVFRDYQRMRLEVATAGLEMIEPLAEPVALRQNLRWELERLLGRAQARSGGIGGLPIPASS